MSEKSEQAAIKTQQTTETGKILMTINNLHEKCVGDPHAKEKSTIERGEMIISKKEYEDSNTDQYKNYNNTGNSCKKAIE